jgi:hypothetical protein
MPQIFLIIASILVAVPALAQNPRVARSTDPTVAVAPPNAGTTPPEKMQKGVITPPNVDQGMTVTPPQNSGGAMPVIPPPGSSGGNQSTTPK